MKEPLFDLHTHSTKSDGKLSPGELMRSAAKKGLKAVALTDHDVITGIPEAQKSAMENDILLIKGVEIEINWNESFIVNGAEEDFRREFHLLGLGIDEPSSGFNTLMDDLLSSRHKRNLLMTEKMRSLSLPCDLDEIYKISGTAFLGRPHFAEYLVKKGVVKSFDEAFKKYLSKDSPVYVPKKGAELSRALAVIKESGGIAVIAHPSTLYLSRGRMEAVLRKLKSSGLDGIECYHPLFSRSDSARFVSLAKSLSLCITAGSDYHGEGRRDRKLGESAGGIKITKELFDFSPLSGAQKVLGKSLRDFIDLL